MTEGTADGSRVIGYPTDNTNGMLDGGQSPTPLGYVNKFAVTGDTILPYSLYGGSSTYYCDFFDQNNFGLRFGIVGGNSGGGAYCGFYVNLSAFVDYKEWGIGGSLSCKPLAR